MIAPNVIWKPQSRPQHRALASSVDELFYGGAKGGAKSETIVIKPLQQIHIPSFRALLLRETYDELEELLSRAQKYYSRLPCKPAWNGQWMEWRFPNPHTRTGAGGAFVKFGYCRTRAHTTRYQGREWGMIGFDEAANVAEIAQIWGDLAKEVRSPDPRVVCQIMATGNPSYAGHGFFKRHFVTPCGKKGGISRFTYELPGFEGLSRTREFIPSRVYDNPVYANDKRYLATLMSLPEERRKALMEGDWDTGTGLALPQLDKSVHLIQPFKLPHYWKLIGGFDWGFAHKWVFGWAAVTEDGDLIGIGTLRGRGDLPHEIAKEIRRSCPDIDRLEYVSAGHDTWRVDKSRGDQTPKIAEAMQAEGIPLVHANQDRVHGLNNLRSYTAWRRQGRNEQDIEPGLRWFNNEGNNWAFEVLESIVVDPDNPERALKVDVDPETGEGGDDAFDMWRYLVASRPPRAVEAIMDEQVKAFAPATLAYEADQGRRVRSPDAKKPDGEEALSMGEEMD